MKRAESDAAKRRRAEDRRRRAEQNAGAPQGGSIPTIIETQPAPGSQQPS
jgi:hypothetical protein